jgi:hypothetical protein
MGTLIDAVPELLGGFGAGLLLAGATWIVRKVRSRSTAQPLLRQYTVLYSESPEGRPERFASGQPAGSIVLHLIEGRVQRLVLTETQLSDGTFAAQPSAS